MAQLQDSQVPGVSRGELAAPVPVIAEASWLILDRLGPAAPSRSRQIRSKCGPRILLANLPAIWRAVPECAEQRPADRSLQRAGHEREGWVQGVTCWIRQVGVGVGKIRRLHAPAAVRVQPAGTHVPLADGDKDFDSVAHDVRSSRGGELSCRLALYLR